MTNVGKLEVALGADRSALSTWGYTYTDISNRTYKNSTTIKVGHEERSSQLNPSSMALALMNKDGALTPGNPEGSYYPNWDQGALVRYSVDNQSSYLRLEGTTSNASTPDAASLDITGDNFGAIQFRGPCPSPRDVLGFGDSDKRIAPLANKWTNASDQRTFNVWLFDGCPRLSWAPAGTAASAIVEEGTARVPQPSAGSNTLGWHIDVNNGLGGYTITWYWMRDTISALRTAISAGDLSVRLGSQIIRTAGTTSFFSSTAILRVGNNPDLTGKCWGQIEAFEWRSGDHTGTVVANPDFTAQAAGTGSFADTAAVPKTWTINSPAVIDDLEPRQIAELSSIRPVWVAGGTDAGSTVNATAQGVSRRLRQGEQPLESALTKWIKNLDRLYGDIITHWSFEDGEDATQIANSISNGFPLTLRHDYTLGANAGSLKAAKSVMSVAAGENVYQVGSLPLIPQSVGVKWQYFRLIRIKTPETSPGSTNLGAIDTNGRAATWRIVINDTNLTALAIDDDGTTFATTNRSVNFATLGGEWMWIFLKVTDNGANVDYEIGWTLVTGPSAGTGSSTSASFAGNTGVPKRFRNGLTAPTDGIEVSHIVFGHNVAVLSEPPLDNYPASVAYNGEEAAYRILRLCIEEGVYISIHGDNKDGYSPYTADPVKSRSGTPMGPQLADKTLTQLLEEAAEADGGILTEHRTELGYHYRTRGSLYNQSARLDFDGALVESLEPIADDAKRNNSIALHRTNGSSYTISDQDSIAKHGLYEDSPSISLQTDEQLADQANWRLHLGTNEDMRVPSLTVELANDSANLIPAWLKFSLGDVLAGQSVPGSWPNNEIRKLAEGYVETITPFTWTVEALTSHAQLWDVGTVDANTPTSGAYRIDTDGSTLNGTLTTTATSVSVAFTGTRWATTASESAHLPFDIIIGGEVMTVTAVTGTTSPQTFTVTRSVNGIVKSHLTDAAVELYKPLRLVI